MVPPVVFTEACPLLCPKQITGVVVEILAISCVGCEIMMVSFLVHPLESVVVRKYVPAGLLMRVSDVVPVFHV
jgi:hypothetical protein